MNNINHNPANSTNSKSQLTNKKGTVKLPSSKAKRSLLALVVVLGVILIAALIKIHSNNSKNKSGQSSKIVPAKITITKDGFVPQTITIKPGTKVEWEDQDDSANHLIASNPYPKDDSMPPLKSKQLGNNTSYDYTFNFSQEKTIYYHDDLHPTLNGTIVVD